MLPTALDQQMQKRRLKVLLRVRLLSKRGEPPNTPLPLRCSNNVSTKAPVDSVAPAAVNDTAQSGAPEKPNATTDDGAEDVPATEAS